MTNQDVIFVEKIRKGYENLFATPLHVNDILLGKSLLLFLLAYPYIILLTTILLIILYLYNHPISVFYSVLQLLIIFPVTLFSISTIIVAIIMQFKSGQQLIQILMFLIIFVIFGGIFSIPAITGIKIDLSQNTLPPLFDIQLVFAVLAIIMMALAYILLHYIDKEKIVMTS